MQVEVRRIRVSPSAIRTRSAGSARLPRRLRTGRRPVRFTAPPYTEFDSPLRTQKRATTGCQSWPTFTNMVEVSAKESNASAEARVPYVCGQSDLASQLLAGVAWNSD